MEKIATVSIEFVPVVGNFQLMMVDGKPSCLVERGKETDKGEGMWISYPLASLARQFPGMTITIQSNSHLTYGKEVSERESLLQLAQAVVGDTDA